MFNPFVVHNAKQYYRFLSSGFIHSNTVHLLFNMIGLFFLGPPLERQFGRKTFFWFYTVCGLVGGGLYLAMSASTGYSHVPIIGASGCVLGLLAGCAILTPRMIIILLFFPVPIRVAALLFVGIYVLSMLSTFTRDVGSGLSDAAHLGGMIGGAVWILLGRRREGGRPGLVESMRIRKSAGAWEKKQRKQREQEQEVDRILAKVHEQGINALSSREKRILRQATEDQKQQDRDIDRKFRER
jgi:membrane associated rhomboid family serine protease